jgi:methionyl-tRNA formyltransferase
MKLVFLGSPAFAVPSLRALHEAGQEVALVLTRPDRPRGRGRKPGPTAVKRAALELDVEVYQPASANAPDAVRAIAAKGPELGVVVAYGQILSPELLGAVTGGFLNLHASLLPLHRGAAPVNWALIRGDEVTGVTVIRMEPELDAGPILAQREVPIRPDETAGELADRLAEIGAETLADVVDRLASGDEVRERPQTGEPGPPARKLTKQDGRLDWSLAAEDLRNRVRGLTPWPGAYCEVIGDDGAQRVTLLRVSVAEDDAAPGAEEPGTVLRTGADGIVAQAGDGLLRVEELKPAGARAMSAADFVNGYHVAPGNRFA